MATDWQWHYLERDHIEDGTNAGTLRIKLPEREQISVIEVEYVAMQHLTGFDKTALGIDLVKKLEVIADGATVLYSMKPHTASYIQYCRMKKMPKMQFCITGTGYPVMTIKIMFGPKMRDEDYMLDTSVYNNVYLEIPWELDPTKYVTHTFKYTIRYLRPMEKLTPKGFFRSRDIEYGGKAWAAAGHHYVDLPLKYPWYRLGYKHDRPEELMGVDLTHVKLDIDDGRYVLVDADADDLEAIESERQWFPVTTSYHHVHFTNAVLLSLYAFMGYPYEAGFSLISDIHGGITLFWEGWGDLCNVAMVDDARVYQEARGTITFRGGNYMACQTIKDWEDTEPFDAGSYSEAQIDFTHTAVTLEDLRIFLTEICPLKIGGAP